MMYYTPITGPRAGPIKGAAAKRVIARPRCLAANISAIVPPAYQVEYKIKEKKCAYFHSTYIR